jgi:hypothetical protein
MGDPPNPPPVAIAHARGCTRAPQTHHAASLAGTLRHLATLDNKFNDGAADELDVEDFREHEESMRICLLCTLNLSTESEFHWEICSRFLDPLLEMAFDEENMSIGKLCCKVRVGRIGGGAHTQHHVTRPN